MTAAFPRWVRRNLLATPFDTALSILFIPLCLWMMFSVGNWAITQAQWHVVGDNLRVLMVGTLPGEMTIQPWLATGILALVSGMTVALVTCARRRALGIGVDIAALAAAGCVFTGSIPLACALGCVAVGLAGWLAVDVWPSLRKMVGVAWLLGLLFIGALLAPAGTERWGGLLMGVLFTLLAAILSVPLGIGLALGRRSRFASARIICTGYIEVMRSLPLILIVYWVWIITPLVSPQNAMPDLLRGLLGFTLFFAAYVAEYVRSGLQSVPRGQIEAAQSLGMSPAQISRDVVLPQAFRVVMPALVGNVLDIFNNVPLLFIIGLTDFLRAGQMVLVNPQSGGRTYELYAFMFLVYLAVASVITFGARRLEARMAIGHR
ncbi:amino acid ABC transporter permease [Cupriavidus sp. YAF13]|uniref:amino acid ABC transporter permease n=1 Tax=Cupriavidus sp. YAF13 TaxID=3233075 RepID=UPI003F8F4D90